MSFLKNIAKSVGISLKDKKDSFTNKGEEERSPVNFETMEKGDFVELGIFDIFELSGKSSEITNSNNYVDVETDKSRIEYSIICEGENLKLSSDDTNSNRIILSKRESTGEVVSILKERDIGDLIESNPSDNVTVKAKKKNHGNLWYGKKYRKGKFRKETLNGEPVDYYLLIGDDNLHVLQLYVYEDRTDVYVGFSYKKESLIKDIFIKT